MGLNLWNLLFLNMTEFVSGHEDESRSRPSRQPHHIKLDKSGSSGGKPDNSGPGGSEEKQNRDQTPDTSVLPTDRGVSTPTGKVFR